MGAIKVWRNHRDKVLAELCAMLLGRRLFRIKLSSDPINKNQVETVRKKIMKTYQLLNQEAAYLFSYGTVSHEAYSSDGEHIQVLLKNGEVKELAEASDLPQLKAMTKSVKKDFLCWPKHVDL